MSGVPLVTGVGLAIALSLFNAVLLVWLSLTVLLNSDRRAWGHWLAGAGLGLGALFFFSHAAILDRGVLSIGLGMLFWWTGGLVPALALPYAWTVVVLWYTGVTTGRAPRRGQRLGLLFITLLLLAGLAALLAGGVLIADLFLASPVLSLFRLAVRWSLLGIPLLAVGYSVYVFSCIGLAINALARPGPTDRVMGVQARQRARPWLFAVSGGLLLISLLGVGVLLLVVQGTRTQSFFAYYGANAGWIAWLDLIITGLIALIILLLGQAVVAYEVFTGKSLPRHGLVRRWRQAVLLAAGFGLLVGAGLAGRLRLIDGLLLAALFAAVYFALISWRSFQERERFMANLRPFVRSQRLYDQLLGRAAGVPGAGPFESLCADVLDARFAYLGALGPLAPLAGAPLAFPAGQPALEGRLAQIGRQLIAQLDTLTTTMGCFLEQLAPALGAPPLSGNTWAVPLVGERGVVGLLLLGPKRSGEFYTQEEIEIARASCERLLDAQASSAMAQRLMALQRQRLQESQIVDRRARRVLHDDILPYLHTAMLALDEPAADRGPVLGLLADAHREISNLLRDLPAGALPELQRLGLLGTLRQVTTVELADLFDDIVWDVSESTAAAGDRLPLLMAEVLFYAAREAMRNAGRHGRGAGDNGRLTLTVGGHATAGTFSLSIVDNGVGIADPATGAQTGGSGQGLALHSTMMAVIGGTLALESDPGHYTRVTLTAPLS